MTASQESKKPIRLKQRAPLSETGCKMYCVTIYNENLRKLNGDESVRMTRLIIIRTAGRHTYLLTNCFQVLHPDQL